MRFVDTNILIYAASPNHDEATKQDIAVKLLKDEELTMSVQVLQEFYSKVTHPNHPAPMSDDLALRFIGSLDGLSVRDITLETFHSAVRISRRYRLSYWDGAILAAARAAGCDAVYSEDLSSEQDYGGVRVINPFENL